MRGSGFGVMVVVVLLFLALGGWVRNIEMLRRCDFQAPYKTEVIRVIGLVPVVGMVVGWMDVGEEVKK